MDAAASGAQVAAGRIDLREWSNGVLTTALLSVRQNRVGLTASGLASSPAEAKPAQPGVGSAINPRGDGDKQILIAEESAK